MVRLKVDSKDNLFGYSRFQFHYGTIKRQLAVEDVLHTCYIFNSTMVRLKALRIREASRIRTFQFHYGTIKREERTRAEELL